MNIIYNKYFINFHEIQLISYTTPHTHILTKKFQSHVPIFKGIAHNIKMFINRVLKH